MNFELEVQPPFRDEITSISISGEHAEEVLNILAARLSSAEFEIWIEDEDGEMIPFEEYEHE